MSSLASHGRHLFSQATGHADENEAAAADDDDFDLAFSDSDDDSSSGEQKTSGGGGGAMSFGCVEEAVSETESQAVKPFIGAIFPPDNHQPSHGHNEAPNATLQLEYVFGYCKNTRDAIFSLGNNQVFWPSASVGILYNQNQAGSASAQSHLIGHRDEITAAAQSSSNPQFIATGSSQLTRKHEYPTAIVWDTRNNAQINSYQSVHLKRQVDALAFDDSGQYLFAAGAGDKHNIVCYNVRDGSETSYVSSGSSRVLAMEYDSSTRSLVVGGVKSLQFISFGNGTFGTPQRVSADTFVSIKSSGGTTYCGSARGKIITYKRGAQSGSVNGHKGGVYSIAVQGRNVATGGKNGTVTVWKDESHGLSKLRTFNLALPGAAKGIAFNGPDVVVGSKNGRVVQLNTSTGEETLLGSGHCDGETWGLAMHPFDMQCVTTGDDNMIRCWDLVSMTCTKSKKLSNVKIKIGNQNKSTRVKSRSSQRRGKRGGAATTGSFGPSNCSRAVDYDPFGEHIAVGMNDGSFMVLDEATLSKVAHKRGRGRSQWVQGTAFSPLFFYCVWFIVVERGGGLMIHLACHTYIMLPVVHLLNFFFSLLLLLFCSLLY
jgi:WD40 repeat protein